MFTGFLKMSEDPDFFEGAQSGMYVAVLTAVETALWDLAGKALGLPVYQLLGGKFRDKIRVYCDTALYQNNRPTPKDFADSALRRRRWVLMPSNLISISGMILLNSI